MRAQYATDADDLDAFLEDLPAAPRVTWVRPGAAPLAREIFPHGECFGVRTRPLINTDTVDLFVYTLRDTHVFEHLRRMYGAGEDLAGTALWYVDTQTTIECVEVIPVRGALDAASELRVGERLKAECGFSDPPDMHRFAQVLVRLDLTYRDDDDEETWVLLVAIDEEDEATAPMLQRLRSGSALQRP